MKAANPNSVAAIGSDIPFSTYDWLAQNPLIFASFIAAGVALIVGLLTFFGVILSNREATKRLRNELVHNASQADQNREHASHQADLNRQHTSTEAQIERLTTLRREVYLVAVEELVKTQGFLAQLPRVDPSDTAQLSTIQSLAGAVGRVTVVGSQGTALKARQLMGLYGEAYLKGMKLLQPSAPLKAHESLQWNLYNKAQAEIARIISQITQLNETNTCTPEITQALSRSFDIQQENARKSREELDAIQREIGKITHNYLKIFLQNLDEFSKEVDELLCLIRCELGLTADLNEFRTQSMEMQRRMKAVVALLDVRVSDPGQQLEASASAPMPAPPPA